MIGIEYQYKEPNEDTIIIRAYDAPGDQDWIGTATLHQGQYIHSVEVKEKYRRQGIATQLVKACIKESDKPKISLVARQSKIAACGLYEKLGFKVVEKSATCQYADVKEDYYLTYVLERDKNDIKTS